MLRERIACVLLGALAVWAAGAYAVVMILAYPHLSDPDQRAVFLMGGLLLLIWCVIGGALMRTFRDRFKALMARVRVRWQVKFFLLFLVGALLEEAVTTSLTNAAPLLGGVTDAARITASKNYLEVVCKHSVVVFVPGFVAWTIVLSLWDFRPSEVMLLWGLMGWLAEWMTFGSHNIGMVGMWVWVYGLMVYLPAHAVPPDRKVWRVRWWVYPVPFLVTVVCGILYYVAGSLAIQALRSLWWPYRS